MLNKKKQEIKIGLPRALHYYKYHAAWETFFKKLGFTVLTSPPTNREILKRGIDLAVDESCLSVKIYLGHVDYLIKRGVDFIFVPRLVSLRHGENLCTKFMALNDIIQNTFPAIKIIDYTIDANNYQFEFWRVLKATFSFNNNPFRILRSYFQSKRVLANDLKDKNQAQEEKVRCHDKSRPLIMIVSHAYTSYDALLGLPIVAYLEKQDADVIFADSVDPKKTGPLAKTISRDIYWTHNKEMVGAIEYYRKYLDGIIFLMTFPCGPDALVIDLCQHKIKDVPIAVITLDELSGEAGLKTRLESFVDILKFKKKSHATH